LCCIHKKAACKGGSKAIDWAKSSGLSGEGLPDLAVSVAGTTSRVFCSALANLTVANIRDDDGGTSQATRIMVRKAWGQVRRKMFAIIAITGMSTLLVDFLAVALGT
jgi:hypothetical protein